MEAGIQIHFLVRVSKTQATVTITATAYGKELEIAREGVSARYFGLGKFA
jgi:hypothetical protein